MALQRSNTIDTDELTHEYVLDSLKKRNAEPAKRVLLVEQEMLVRKIKYATVGLGGLRRLLSAELKVKELSVMS